MILVRFFLIFCLFFLTEVRAEKLLTIPTLMVHGYARIYKPADQISLSVGVVTQADSAEVALRKNSSNMEDIIDSLKSAGLSDNEFSTGQFSIRPIYSEQPHPSPPKWVPHIVGYEVTNSINIKTDKIRLVGALIDSATNAGATTIDNIQFSIKDTRMYRDQIIVDACSNALADAIVLSKSTKVNLLKVHAVFLDDNRNAVARTPFAANSIATVPIEPGEVEIAASVTVIFEVD